MSFTLRLIFAIVFIFKSCTSSLGHESSILDGERTGLHYRDVDKRQAYAQETDVKAPTCPKCSNKLKDETHWKTELFKQRILTELGLETPPKIDVPLPQLPSDLYLNNLVEENKTEEMDEETRRRFIIGKESTSVDSCPRRKVCYKFETTLLDGEDVIADSIELWVYRQPHSSKQKFDVSVLEFTKNNNESVRRVGNTVMQVSLRHVEGWIKVILPQTVLRRILDRPSYHSLAVTRQTRQRLHKMKTKVASHSPVLAFSMRRHLRQRERLRRQTVCTSGNCCRLQRHVVNIQQDIGWSFVIVPRLLETNICVGTCGDIDWPLGGALRNVTGEYQLCCGPIAYGPPVPFLYFDPEDVVHIATVSNVIVSRCGCL